jgi:hypothetical protein
VRITIAPNPVQESALDIPGCGSDTPYRWRWDQILENTGSSAVSFTQRINFFDGVQVSAPSVSMTLSAGERHTQTTQWCSGANTDHNFRTDWVLTGGARVTGPTVQLLRR